MSMKIKWVILVLSIVILFSILVIHVEPGHIGIARNQITGKMWVCQAGWSINWPWVWIALIDTRPMRVSIESGGRGIDSKLVQFQPEEWKLFVDTEGWRYYWWSNRLSFNWSYKEEHRGMKDILRGYAYSAKKYPFIQVIEEYK